MFGIDGADTVRQDKGHVGSISSVTIGDRKQLAQGSKSSCCVRVGANIAKSAEGADDLTTVLGVAEVVSDLSDVGIDNDADLRRIWPDVEVVDDVDQESSHQVPVIYASSVVIANTTRTVDDKRKIRLRSTPWPTSTLTSLTLN